MNNPEDIEQGDELSADSILRPIWQGRRVIVFGALLAVVLAIVIGGAFYLFQPSRWMASLGFRPLFVGAESGRYPNDLPFATTDINDRSVVDKVFEQNHVQEFCERDEFRSGFTVEKSSAQLRFLDAEYQSRLGDPKATAVERQRLQDEYQGKRDSISAQFQLAFVRSPECSRLPAQLVYKSLNDLLQVWAEDAESKRGVLKLQIALFTPNIFDFSNMPGESLLVRADLIRSALARALENAQQIRALPGAAAVRVGKDQTSIQQVIAELEDLAKARLDPLVSVAGRGLGRESARWLDEALKTAGLGAKAAEERRVAYLTALREYSGTTPSSTAATVAGARPQGTNDVQTQLDATFIDKIVALSTVNTAYRQNLTNQMLRAAVDAVQSNAAVERYRQLKDSLSGGVASDLTLGEVAKKLDAVVEDGKRSVAEMDALYDEFSRVSMRPAGGMYRIEQAAHGQTLASFGLRSYLVIVVGVLFASPVILAAACLALYHFRALARTLNTPSVQS